MTLARSILVILVAVLVLQYWLKPQPEPEEILTTGRVRTTVEPANTMCLDGMKWDRCVTDATGRMWTGLPGLNSDGDDVSESDECQQGTTLGAGKSCKLFIPMGGKP